MRLSVREGVMSILLTCLNLRSNIFNSKNSKCNMIYNVPCIMVYGNSTCLLQTFHFLNLFFENGNLQIKP